MPNTFELIASSTLGSAQSSIDFSSIPNTFTDLCLKVSLRTSVAAVNDDLYLRINNDSGSNYSFRDIRGSGSAVSSRNGSNVFLFSEAINGANSTSNTFINHEFYIPNYAGSTAKSISLDAAMENNATAAELNLLAGLWNQTAAINRLTLIPGFANFVANSTAYLYGVKNA